MSKGFFTDKTFEPTDNDILNIIGKAKNNWEFLFRTITQELNLKGDFKFYGINYGWAIRFNKYGRSIIALYPNKDSFTVQIILNNKQVESALSQDLDTKIIKTINDTESIHEGKWIYLKIDNESDLKGILKLINIRIEIKNQD